MHLRSAIRIAVVLLLPTALLAQSASTFLKARSAPQRCAALMPWLEDVGRLAGETQDGSFAQFTPRAAPAFADSFFVARIGASYTSLAADDRKRIAESLNTCDNRRAWIREKVAHAFVDERASVHAKTWREEISRTLALAGGGAGSATTTSAASSPATAAAVAGRPVSVESPPPAATPARATTTTAPPPDLAVPLTGKWVGVYHVYPSYQLITVQFPPTPGTDGSYAADMRIEPLAGQTAPHMGVVPVRALYDSRTRTIDIAPSNTAARGIRIGLGPLRGVYDAERKAFAGVQVNARTDASPYFIFAREDDADAVFLKRLKSANRENARPGTPAGALFARGPDDGKMREWAMQFDREYPGGNAYQTEMGSLYLKARNLFRDEYFERYFGKPYDELGGGELAKIERSLRGVKAPRANFPEEAANGVLLAIARAFYQSSATYASMDVTLSVVSMRSMNAWLRQTTGRLPRLPEHATSFAALGLLDQAINSTFSTFWPSERTAFTAAVSDTRQRLATPILTAMIDSLINSARDFQSLPTLIAVQSMSVPGLPPASDAGSTVRGGRGGGARGGGGGGRGEAVSYGGEVSVDLRTLVQYAPADVQRAQQQRVRERSASIVAAEASSDRAQIARLGSGVEGLQAGVQWYANMRQKYAIVGVESPLPSLAADLATARASQLAAGEAALTRRIEDAATVREVNAILGDHVSVPGDARDQAGARVIAASQTRLAAINRAAEAEARLARQRAEEDAERVERQRASLAGNTDVASGSAGVVTRASFNASGLVNEALLVNVFTGDFDKVSIERDETAFGAMFQQYLDACAVYCVKTLPADKVEMTSQVCETESVTRNGWGVEISRSCVSWRTVGRGLYADPRLYGAKRALDAGNVGNALRNMVSLMKSSDPLGTMGQQVSSSLSFIQDMKQLVQMNPCASPAMKRFEANLVLFSQGKQPIKYGVDARAVAASTPFRESNYSRLAEDLVYEDSRKWALNRYLRMSVSGVTVTSRDASGRPMKLSGRYGYEGINGRTVGEFTLSFSDGMPECLFFSDASYTCRSVNRQIASAYANGRYWVQ